MSEQAVAETERRFLITVEKPWKLWIWPSLGLLYFLLVVLVVSVPIRTPVPDQAWVLGGVGLFALLVLIQLLLLPTRRVRRKKARAAAAAAAPEAMDLEAQAEQFVSDAPPVAAPAPAAAAGPDCEYLLTTEEHKGRRVLEVSLPAKTRHRGAVYAKAYVAVDDRFVLRVEDLVAERSELV